MSTASATRYGRAHGEFSRKRLPLIPVIVLAAAFIAFGPARATGATLTPFTTCDLATGEDTAFPGVAFDCETQFATYNSVDTSNTFRVTEPSGTAKPAHAAQLDPLQTPSYYHAFPLSENAHTHPQ